MNKTATVELFLFIAGEEGIDLTALSNLTEIPQQACLQQIDYLQKKYENDEESAFFILESAQKYHLTTKDKFKELLKNYAKSPVNQSLSKSAMEVLSIVAYKQPITRLQIDQIRGVNSSGVLSTLRAFNLVEKVGTLEVIGRPGLYATTEFFLDFIGINDLEKLPEINEEDFIPEEQNLFDTNGLEMSEDEN